MQPGHPRPLEAEGGHGHGPSAVERPEQGRHRHAGIGEEELAERLFAGDGAERTDLDARRPEVDEQAADALVLRHRRIRPHVELTPVGQVPETVPRLLAVEHEFVPVPYGTGPQRGEVAPGIGLGHALGPDLVPPEHGTEEAFLLLVGPVGHDRRCDVGDADHVDGTRGRRRTHLFEVGELLVDARIAPAVLERPCRRRPSGVGQLPVPPAQDLEVRRLGSALTGAGHFVRQVVVQPRPQRQPQPGAGVDSTGGGIGPVGRQGVHGHRWVLLGARPRPPSERRAAMRRPQ